MNLLAGLLCIASLVLYIIVDGIGSNIGCSGDDGRGCNVSRLVYEHISLFHSDISETLFQSLFFFFIILIISSSSRNMNV